MINNSTNLINKIIHKINISSKSCIIIILVYIFDISLANRVVGYYPNWVSSQMAASSINYEVVTHVNHAFAWPDESGNILSYNNMLSLDFCQTIQSNGAKVILSLGGWGNDVGFRTVSASSELRELFIDNLINIVDTYGYNGVDLDWEHPTSNIDRQNLNLLVSEMDSVFNSHNPDLLITMAVPISNWSGQWYDFSFLRFYIDFFNAMTYDIHGGWSSNAGHNSPLFSSPSGDPDGSCETGIDYLVYSRGIPSEQINLGLPFWGKKYNATDINMPFTGEVVDKLYSEIPSLINNGWSYEWDSTAYAPYLKKDDGTKIITFDNEESIKYKCDFAHNRGLGGVMIWALSYDLVQSEQRLINSIKENYLFLEYNTENLLPNNFSMKSYPNPFNSNNTIELDLKSDENISINLISLNGSFIGELINQNISKGKFYLKWDMKDFSSKVGSGVFFIRASSNNNQIVKKIIYLK